MSLDLKQSSSKITLWVIGAVIVIVVIWFVVSVLTAEGEGGFDEKLAKMFGWGVVESDGNEIPESFSIDNGGDDKDDKKDEPEKKNESKLELTPATNAPTNNCTVKYGNLMLINPVFTVEDEFMPVRQSELISLNSTYGIQELNAWNGDNLMDAEAGTHLNDMLNAYKTDYPGHEMQTVSCFRAAGTSCGRLCMPTGASDHHTGMSCDLIDVAYGTSLDTGTYNQHLDWQWLHDNSYKYGFINRFPENWTGGPMSEPMNIDENGTTGLLETWHYRYVGVDFATDIATGKYNNGEYDSLEHYLKARGLVTDLKAGKCSDS